MKGLVTRSGAGGNLLDLELSLRIPCSGLADRVRSDLAGATAGATVGRLYSLVAFADLGGWSVKDRSQTVSAGRARRPSSVARRRRVPGPRFECRTAGGRRCPQCGRSTRRRRPFERDRIVGDPDAIVGYLRVPVRRCRVRALHVPMARLPRCPSFGQVLDQDFENLPGFSEGCSRHRGIRDPQLPGTARDPRARGHRQLLAQ